MSTVKRVHADPLRCDDYALRVAEHQTVPAPDTNIHLAGKERHAHRLRYPPPLEQLGLGPRLEHDARQTVDGRVTPSSRADLCVSRNMLPLRSPRFAPVPALRATDFRYHGLQLSYYGSIVHGCLEATLP